MSKKKNRNRSVNTHFWKDTYTGDLDRDAKFLYLYFITNPLTNMLGIYEIRINRICFDTGLERDRVKELLEQFAKKGKVKYIDGYIILVNFVKHQNYNTNMIKSAINEMPELPDSIKQTSIFRRVVDWFKENYPDLEVVKGLTIPNKQMDLGDEMGQQQNEPEDKSPQKSSSSRKWVTKGVPIPEVLRTDEFKEVIEHYWKHLESTFKKTPSIPMVGGKMKRLIELKQKGNEPAKVVQQTINDGNKKFYAITDKQFESNEKSNGNGAKSRADEHFENSQNVINQFRKENAN